ncbi:MAG: hypothetical protein KIS81_10510 [Maricaulaceae bacterium]|nr:hypothetical protein [Maricaulaceae bacterium]
MTRKLAIAGAAAIIAGFTAFSAAASAEDGDAQEPRCLRLFNINSYTVIDDYHLVLRGGANRHFLVTTRGRCPALRWGMQIRTSFGATTTMCRPYAEVIHTSDGGLCGIDLIERVDSYRAARALVEERTAERQAAQAAAE